MICDKPLKNMQWFKDVKLGIFMHWGIYSVLGVEESWSFFNGDVDYDTYMNQLNGFTAEKYDPKKWAELFQKIGAKYTVLTTKHHDGVALWDTKVSELSVVHKTPAGRDLIGPYCEAIKEQGLKVGLYYSHLDWNHPDYPSLVPHSDEWWARSVYNCPGDGKDDLEAWNRFLKFHRTQLAELLTNYGKIDLLWFDGVWERTEEQWDFKGMNDYIRSLNPEIIINSRIGGYGDYQTPEQAIPVSRPQGPWEFCVTLNDSWGYNPKDENYKSTRQLVRIFTECISMGGNLLLDIGPKPDGTIDEQDEKALLDFGTWVNQYQEAIYDTDAGLPHGLFMGNSTISKDRKTLYLFYYDKPMGELALKGIKTAVKKMSVLGAEAGAEREISFYKVGGFLDMPGMLWINLPQDYVDENCTVIKVEFEEALDIYTGAGGGIK